MKTEIELPKDESELRYLNLKDVLEMKHRKESLKEKLIFKVKSNPFIPLGLGATTLIVTLGIRQFAKRNTVKQQKYMRGRIIAQFLTFASFIAGTAYYQWKENQKEKMN